MSVVGYIHLSFPHKTWEIEMILDPYPPNFLSLSFDVFGPNKILLLGEKKLARLFIQRKEFLQQIS